MDVTTVVLDPHSSRSAATAQVAHFWHMNTTATEAERQHESSQTAAKEVQLNRRIIHPLHKLTKPNVLDGIVTGVPGGVVLGRLGLLTGIATLAVSSAVVGGIVKASIRR